MNGMNLVTKFFSKMYSDIDDTIKNMMLKYLEIAFPVSRIKIDKKFRRAIVLENGIHLLGNCSSIMFLRNSLSEELKLVFNCDNATSFAILDNFLNLKKQV